MSFKLNKLNMSDNSGNRPSFRKPRKPGEGPNPNGEFDWSKIIRSVFSWGAVIVLAVIVLQFLRSGSSNPTEVTYDIYENFLQEEKIIEAKVVKTDPNDFTFEGTLKQEEVVVINDRTVHIKRFSVFIPDALLKDQETIWKSKNIKYSFSKESNEWLNILLSFIPWILIIAVWVFIMRRMQAGAGGTRGIFNFGKSKAKLISESATKVTFKDVAGADEAKQELEEIIEFLKEPAKFQKLGGKIPRGVLLLGPPGTGKTLLARAVAGEAGVPFFSISGADFVEMFVGVGASRVRDLFDQGKKNAPCIIFIDEIDAVGRHRGAGIGGGHDEREQTLNQLLVEMDGFEQNSGVIIIAATNRPDVLDPALLRPGRFDRQIVVDRPDVKGREGILKVHTRKIPLDSDVDLNVLAKGTPGLAGADIANMVNEAALLAARKNKKTVSMIDFEEAKDKVMMGMERKSMIISEEEKKITSYHEIGHVLVARKLPEADPVHKVTIIPRGRALGVTTYLPVDEKHTYSKEYLETMITYALGGRAAEKLVFNRFTTGAGNDIERASSLARKMVCEWGMSEKLGPLSYGTKEEEIFLGREITRHKDYSEKTAQEIDDEIKKIVLSCMERAQDILADNIDTLHRLSSVLLEREILDSEEIDKIIRGEQLPPIKKNGTGEPEKKVEEIPEHVVKLMEKKKQKESLEKDDAN
jgi:cell division protease FtsH